MDEVAASESSVPTVKVPLAVYTVEEDEINRVPSTATVGFALKYTVLPVTVKSYAVQRKLDGEVMVEDNHTSLRNCAAPGAAPGV